MLPLHQRRSPACQLPLRLLLILEQVFCRNKFEHCINEDNCRDLVLMCPECYEHIETRHCGKPECAEVAAKLAATL